MKEKILWDKLPSRYIRCIKGCEQQEKCLHYQVYVSASPDERPLFIYDPRYRKEDEECPHFESTVPVLRAKGFKSGMKYIPHGKVQEVRLHLMATLGRAQAWYYKAYRGENTLSLDQMKAVERVFKHYGVGSDKIFDHYVEEYPSTPH